MLTSIREELGTLAGELLELVAPDRCAVCDRAIPAGPVAGWCDGCLERVTLCDADRCAACGGPLEAWGACPGCIAAGRPWDGVRAATEHEGVMRDLLGRWKYGPDPVLSRALGELLVATTTGTLASPGGSLVVPVPQHPDAWRRRGFHPAGDLAAAVARAQGGRLLGPLRRDRRGAPQVGLTAVERRRNVMRLYRVPARARRRLSGRPVLLVDDVVTTTATAAACAAALRGAGAAPIVVLALARAMA